MPPVQFEDPTYLETVYATLFTLLKGATFPAGITFKSTQRVVAPPDDVPATMQPALFLFPGPLPVEQKSEFGAAKWTFTAIAVIYVRADSAALNQNPLPATVVNYIIWGLANIFNTAPPYQKQTLGGLVYHCWLEGEVVPEVQNEQIVIALPIYILPGPYG